jgi:hypothetical protein
MKQTGFIRSTNNKTTKVASVAPTTIQARKEPLLIGYHSFSSAGNRTFSRPVKTSVWVGSLACI